MRIWDKKLIPYLCRRHLVAMWREGLGAYKIVTTNTKAYRNHPAVVEFLCAPDLLYERLELVRAEMIRRGYNPKQMPKQKKTKFMDDIQVSWNKAKTWQTIEEQLEVLHQKGCTCMITHLRDKYIQAKELKSLYILVFVSLFYSAMLFYVIPQVLLLFLRGMR